MMSPSPIVFALANPIPEIMPHQAREAGASIIATGRTDFNNQINNALVFPGVFRGLLDDRIKQITEQTKINIAQCLAALVKKPTPDKIIPNVFEKNIVKKIAQSVKIKKS